MYLVEQLSKIDWADDVICCSRQLGFIIDQIQWDDDFEVASSVSESILRVLAEPSILTCLVKNYDKSLSERYDLLTKIVLLGTENGSRLRLHIFEGGHYDRPHDHRWPYTAYIIRGGYTHRLFSTINQNSLETTQYDLQPVFIEQRLSKTSYTLNTGIFHAVTTGLQGAISLILRGPATSSAFRIIDRVTGKAWTQYGANYESDEEKAQKILTYAHLEEKFTLLKNLGIING